jgi:hypothetical protein
MTDDYQALRDWMHRPAVQAAVARQLAQAEAEQEPPEQGQTGAGR